MADLVEQLLARPGRYVGAELSPADGDGAAPGVARIDVAALPGGSGAMLVYEVLSAEGSLSHHEHAVIARTTSGLVLVTSHTHADVTTVIAEAADEPGWFPAADGSTRFPMAIRVAVPEPGHLVYSWSYGWDDHPLEVRDIADVRLTD